MIINCNNTKTDKLVVKEKCVGSHFIFLFFYKRVDSFSFVSSSFLLILLHIYQILIKENNYFRFIRYREDGIQSKHGRFKEKGV